MKRQKFIHEAAQGAGSCPNKWEIDRLEYKPCNEYACELQDASFPARTCNATLDVVLLIDGSGSLGQTGWDAEKKAAAMFVDSFIYGGADAQMAVILFSGPSSWYGVYQCIGANAATVDLASVCKITKVTHFTKVLATVKSDIQNMNWPQGSTLTSVALMAAKAELSLGRSDAHSIIIVFTDGRPLSKRKTYQAALEVRKEARLVWVPVTSYAPLSDIKQWATRRWQENVVVVKTFEDLEEPDVVTRIIANICPATLVCQCLVCGTGAVGPWQSGACAAGGSGVGLDCKNNVGVAGCYSSLDTHGCFCPGTVDTR
jgi:Mg-chelatase subunit ChlD